MESNPLESVGVPEKLHTESMDLDPMESEPLESAKTLCRVLGKISLSSVYKMAQAREIPSYRIGRRGIRFDIGEVRKALRR